MDPNLVGGLASGLVSGIGAALGGPTSSASSLSNATSTNFFAPSIFNIGSGSPSTEGDIGATAQNPDSAASAAASEALPPTSALANPLTSLGLSGSTLVWVGIAAAGALVLVLILSRHGK
jgi:hypothetical protein